MYISTNNADEPLNSFQAIQEVLTILVEIAKRNKDEGNFWTYSGCMNPTFIFPPTDHVEFFMGECLPDSINTPWGPIIPFLGGTFTNLNTELIFHNISERITLEFIRNTCEGKQSMKTYREKEDVRFIVNDDRNPISVDQLDKYRNSPHLIQAHHPPHNCNCESIYRITSIDGRRVMSELEERELISESEEREVMSESEERRREWERLTSKSDSWHEIMQLFDKLNRKIED